MEPLNCKCPGCDVDLNTDNVGGYRDYCDACVALIAEIPIPEGGGYIQGKSPKFWFET